MAPPDEVQHRITFGPFEMNASTGELCRAGIPVHLPGQATQILSLLLARSGEIVTREQLREHIWARGTFVDFEQGLYTAMNKLRRALNDSADKRRYIETVPGRGYRFVGALQRVPHLVSVPVAPALPERIAHKHRPRFWRMWPRVPNVVRIAFLSIPVIAFAAVWLPSWMEQQRKLLQMEAKGSVLVETWSGNEVLKGIEYYRQIASLDPNSAPAYSGIASGYVVLSDIFMNPREAMPKAELAATRALKLNPQLPGPHISLGLVKLQFEWDWSGAEKELKTAIALDPHDNLPHELYGWYLMSLGRLEEASAEIRYACTLDPSDDLPLWGLGLTQYFSRRYENAAEEYRRSSALNPKSYWPHMLLGWTLEQQGKWNDAISEMTLASRLTDAPQALAALAQAYASAGQSAEAARLLRELTKLSEERYVSPYDVATIYAANNDTERTLTYLEKAYEDRSGWLPLWLNVDPKFDRMRGEVRFSALLNRVGNGRF